jgi:hypothetical protein
MKFLGLLLSVVMLFDIQVNAQRRAVKPAAKPVAIPAAKPVAKTDVPIPEYFGLYLLSEGKLCGLDVDVNPCPATIATKFGQVAPGNAFGGNIVSSSEIKAIAMSSDSQFVVYNENASAVISVMKLVPLMFVRNVKVNTGWPNNVTRTAVENAWDSNVPLIMGGELGKLNEGTAPAQLLSKPLRDKMMLGVPSRTLAPGLYKLSFGQQVLGNEPRVYFWVGSDAKEAERMKCVDAVHQLTGFQVSVDYKPCEGPEVAEVDVSSPATNAPPAKTPQENAADKRKKLLDELIAINDKFNEARVAGDKAALEILLTDSFHYFDQRFGKDTTRAKFLEKAKKGSVSLLRCSDYQIAYEPAGMPILKYTCSYKAKVLIGSMDYIGTFRNTFEKVSGEWKLSIVQEFAKPAY